MVENFELEQDKSKSLANQINLLKQEVDRLKNELDKDNSQIKDKKEISELLSKSIDGDLSDYLDVRNKEIVLRKKDSTGNIKDNISENRSISRGGRTDKTDGPRNTVNSVGGQSNTNLEVSLKDTIQKMEDDHTVLNEQVSFILKYKFIIIQLVLIKKELKEQKKEVEKYKKLYKDSITLQDSSKSEIVTMLSNLIDKLLLEISLNAKAKEILNRIFKIMGYSELEITERLEKKKKKGLFG